METSPYDGDQSTNYIAGNALSECALPLIFDCIGFAILTESIPLGAEAAASTWTTPSWWSCRMASSSSLAQAGLSWLSVNAAM